MIYNFRFSLFTSCAITAEKSFSLNIDIDTITATGGTLLAGGVKTIEGSEQSYVGTVHSTNSLIKKKVLFFYMYAAYQNKSDIEFTKHSTIDLVRKIEDIN